MATPPYPVGRRWVLATAGRGVIGFAVLGLVGCNQTDTPSGDRSPRLSPSRARSGSPSPRRGLAWSRVDLGFVSAYVLVRGREAAVVDTGIGGSADEIGQVLEEAGPGWGGVRHVVLTHKHPDHVGSIADVMDAAAGATGYAGRKDLALIEAPVPLTAVSDDDEVFGLRIVDTPGHTAGHISVFDADTGVLVAGDALNNQNGLAGSDPQYTENEADAAASVIKLARLAPSALLVGHGAPVTEGASEALEKLASSLQ